MTRSTARIALCTLVALAACRRDDHAARENVPRAADAPAERAETGRDGDLAIGAAFSGALLDGVADGRRDLAALAEGCRGLVVDTGVNHVLSVTEDQPLTLRATPRGVGVADLVLAVRLPDDTWVCADDGVDLDPVMARLFVAGEHHILVGTANATIVPYELELRPGIHTPDPLELGGRFPAPVVEGAPPERTTEGTFGGARVPADTAQVLLTGQAGGTRRAVDLAAGCAGSIAQTPDHVIELLAAQELMFRVRSDGDTTLVIQGPDGLVLCADDDDGLDPIVRAALQPGFYSVYVGAYDDDAVPAYSLSVSR